MTYSSSGWAFADSLSVSSDASSTTSNAGIVRPAWSRRAATPEPSPSSVASATAITMSRRTARVSVSSRAVRTKIGSKPAAWSSSATGSASPSGRRTATAGRAAVDIRSALGFGIACADGDDALARACHPRGEAGHRGQRIAERDVRAVRDVEHELALGTGGDGDRAHAGQAAEVALEARDARDRHEARHDDLRRPFLVADRRVVGTGHQACEAVLEGLRLEPAGVDAGAHRGRGLRVRLLVAAVATDEQLGCGLRDIRGGLRLVRGFRGGLRRDDGLGGCLEGGHDRATIDGIPALVAVG